MTKKELKLWKEYTKWVEKENKPWIEESIRLRKEAVSAIAQASRERFAPMEEWEGLPAWKKLFIFPPRIAPDFHGHFESLGAEIQIRHCLRMIEKPTQEGFMDWLVKKEKV